MHAHSTAKVKEAKHHGQGQDHGIWQNHQQHFPKPRLPVVQKDQTTQTEIAKCKFNFSANTTNIQPNIQKTEVIATLTTSETGKSDDLKEN